MLRRAERVILAATVISRARMVAVTAGAVSDGEADGPGQVERHRGQYQLRTWRKPVRT